MTYRVYAIFDRVAAECTGPQVIFSAKNDGIAQRIFRNGLKGVRHDEFQMFLVGTFDDEKVRLDGLAKPELVPVPPEVAADA